MFDEMADLLELEGENPFRIRAYRNASRVARDLGRELSAMVADEEDLTKLPGIGKDLAQKIREIVVTGESAALRALEAQTPPALVALLKLPGLGPKRVKTLHAELGVRSVDDLKSAALQGKIRELPGFGEKTEQRVLRAIDERADEQGRVKLAVAAGYARALEQYLRLIPGVLEATVAGSFRRRKDTVGDLDIVVTARMPGSVLMDHLVAYEGVANVAAQGPTRATFVLR
jgi:DNA polymerase (family 10)